MKIQKNTFWKIISQITVVFVAILIILSCANQSTNKLKDDFKNPPDSAKPGVYWYFMDGNLSREEMTKDLESMNEAGISNLIFLEVGIGVPRGPVDFMSEEWQDLYVHAVREAERLGIKILLGAGPGWCGSGGPWVKPEEAMKHLVFSETVISGNKKVDIKLPVPEQRSTPWHTMKDPYYEDVVVYAVPNSAKPVIKDINEKALYERYPYSSYPKVKPYLPAPAEFEVTKQNKSLTQKEIIDVSDFMQADGQFVWYAPEGNWTIVRMGSRVTGASTRPSPEPVIGLESDKLNAKAFENHLQNYTDILLEKTAPRKENAGWTGLHIDSWESGSQNWTEGIVDDFQKRRGYDPEPYFLTYTGRAVESIEISERFLWDLRLTCQELLLENHAGFAKNYAHKNGLELTIEPYDMNPAGDLDLGAIADVIMAEFWSKEFGFDTHYAVIEATSISHITGQPVVGAEVFTSNNNEAWQQYPWSMKDQSDWAIAWGVNRFVYHTFAHKPLGDEYRPGMTMGQYGVHWDRGQTWWPMVKAYHKYISRNSYLMQQGQAVSDILYLTPEGAPMIFTPPADALEKNGNIPDKKGYGFDGCSPKMLMERAGVENGKIIFPGATSYEIMVLPNFNTMTPELLKKITSLVEKGARIIGTPPVKSPSLTGYPNCDNQVKALSQKLWGSLQTSEKIIEVKYGKGSIFWGGNLSNHDSEALYPDYESTVEILSEMKITEDFTSGNNSIRYGHRKTVDKDIYFVANRTNEPQKTACIFRASGDPELWSGVDGSMKKLKQYKTVDGLTTIDLEFDPYASYFIIFNSNKAVENTVEKGGTNFKLFNTLKTIEGVWAVSFDPKWGGPEEIKFKKLQDWTEHEMRGIKYFSGIATYKKSFNINNIESKNSKYYIDLGVVKDIARIKLNGKDIGVVWCAPWRIDISSALQDGNNELEIEVANRWINRLLGDRQEPDANVRTVKFENGLMGGKEYKTGRYTFTTQSAMQSFNFEKPLSSGLLGPVTIIESNGI
ncbi:MAG: glycosyl hydrolase [Cyclobacteriaceae bacterium]